MTQLSGHPVVGQSWEGFVIETILAASPWRSHASFYRTSAGAEVDLIIEHKNGRLWAIEIKRGLSAKLGRGFYQACEDIQPERAFAVHAGDDRYPIADGVEAISIRELVKELESVGG